VPCQDTYSSDTERTEEQVPWGSWINDLPAEFFLVVRITAFSQDMDGEVIVKCASPS
jgi:hypothetical protein